MPTAIDVNPVATPLGDLWLAAEADGAVWALDWDEARVRRWLARATDARPVDAAPTARVVQAIERYFDGDLQSLTAIATAAPGTPFQRRVWNEVRAIPAGATASYGDLARRLHAAGSERAIGAANAANPLLLIVPCHRVLGARGDLTGYAAGLSRKRWLLDHERQHSPTAAPGLPFPERSHPPPGR